MAGFSVFRHIPLIFPLYDAGMALNRLFPLLTAWLFVLSGTLHASTLMLSISGHYSASAVSQTTQLWAPSGTWALSFDLSSTPMVSNADSLGFDTQFSNFTYRLNGTSVSVAPNSVTFSTKGNGGLFTVDFGPQGGAAMPEFVFYGPQAFSGTTTSPTFSAASFGVSEWAFSDATTYDDNKSPSSIVTLAPVPEPSAMWLMGLSGVGFAFVRVRRIGR